jgi:hypothetical protein
MPSRSVAVGRVWWWAQNWAQWSQVLAGRVIDKKGLSDQLFHVNRDILLHGPSIMLWSGKGSKRVVIGVWAGMLSARKIFSGWSDHAHAALSGGCSALWIMRT